MSKVIVLNGPPTSGKDTLGMAFKKLIPSVKIHAFGSYLIKFTQKTFDIPDYTWNEWYTTEGKEVKRSKLFGKSCRDLVIHVSENVMKPMFGENVWSNLLTKDAPNDGSFYIVTDLGFPDELAVLRNHFGDKNIHIICLYRDGASYACDSRKYIECPTVCVFRETLTPSFGESVEEAALCLAQKIYRRMFV